VEPSEVAAYRENFPSSVCDVLVLDRDDGGISHCRQSILDHALLCGSRPAHSTSILNSRWYWMLDDDITEWWKRVDGVCVPSDAQMLRELEPSILEHSYKRRMGQASIYHCVWACKSSPDGKDIPATSFNTGMVQVVANNSSEIGNINYDSSLDGMEDQDMTLRLLRSGISTLRFNHYAFKTPRKGSNIGGMQEYYKKYGVEDTIRRFHSKHNSLVKGCVKLNPDRNTIRIHWKKVFGR